MTDLRQKDCDGISSPLVSVVILNYNGKRWLDRCFTSLRQQSIFDRIQVIVADNNSQDGSDAYAAEIMGGWENGSFVQNGGNLGYCAGNNRGAKHATGEFLFFLNNDTWLEKDCLEELVKHVEATGANAATPLMLNYEDDSVQSAGGEGFDFFGLMSFGKPHADVRDVFVAGGCSFFVRRPDFEKLGGFDESLFMYCDEYDLSWRNWIADGRSIIVPSARLHHWGGGSAASGEEAGDRPLKSSYSKRYYTNRNNLMVVLMNGQHILALLALPQILLLIFEAAFSLIVFRKPEYIRRAYLEAVRDCWKLREHIIAARRRNRMLRKRGDWKLMRFFRFRPNRWDEFLSISRRGLPEMVAK